jgi:hypothetical protein
LLMKVEIAFALPLGMSDPITNPNYWRHRAEKTRALADRFQHVRARETDCCGSPRNTTISLNVCRAAEQRSARFGEGVRHLALACGGTRSCAYLPWFGRAKG